MTAIYEFKQKLKNIYGEYEIYLLPVVKFAVALVYFMWINESMGYMNQVNNIFVVLILALICSILPPAVTVVLGFALMLIHCYALGIDVAAFFLVLILVMAIFLLRFSASQNIVLALTPLSFSFNVPVLLPLGSGLLGSGLAAIPAGCGVIVYYFIRFLYGNTQALANTEIEITERLKILCDGLVMNWPMWITLVAFVVVTLLVNLVSSCSFDYSWRVAIVAGGVAYVLVVLAGGFLFDVTVSMTPLITYSVISVVIAVILEFFVFGGDYSRTERLQFEDDEYYYYVKAVPKATVATSERSIKKITSDAGTKQTEGAGASAIIQEEQNAPVQKAAIEDVDFEKKLEESLKDL